MSTDADGNGTCNMFKTYGDIKWIKNHCKPCCIKGSSLGAGVIISQDHLFLDFIQFGIMVWWELIGGLFIESANLSQIYHRFCGH
jgi:hypothetical protein